MFTYDFLLLFCYYLTLYTLKENRRLILSHRHRFQRRHVFLFWHDAIRDE
jgi:hypothetical protein